MKKTYCDICGKEIKGTAKDQPLQIRMDLWYGTVIGSVHKGDKEIDVCESCVKKLCTESLKEDKDEQMASK